MSWNNSPQLPFSADEPQRGPFNLSITNPPYVPAQYNGPRPIADILGLICGALALEIQNNARKNPLRTFMFNQYSRSEGTAPPFTNPDFDALVDATCQYIVLEMNNNKYRDVEQAAQNCIPQMCEMMCAVNLKVYPDLDAYVNSSVVQTLRQTIARFDNIAQQIKNMNSGGWNNRGNSGGGGWGNNNNWGSGGNTGWGNNNNSGGSTNRWSNSSSSGSWGTSSAKPSTGSTGGLFNGDERRSSTSSGSNVGGKWGNTDNPVQQPYQARKPKEQEVEQQEEYQTVQPREASLTSGAIKWKPSRTYPYLPAAAPTVGEIWLREHPPTREYPNGLVEPFLKEKDKSDMDYEKHATGHVFGPVPRNLDISQAATTMAKITAGVQKVNNTNAMSDAERDTPEVKTVVDQTFIIETSLESAWLMGSLKRLKAPEGEVADVFRTYAKIAKPVITPTDMTAVIDGFRQSKTYIELREKLSVAIEEKVAPALWGYVNQKLTDMINRILAQKLCLTGNDGNPVTIDSFLADIEDLIAYLGKQHGQNIQQAFIKRQKDEIHSAFLTLSEKHAKDLTENYLADMVYSEGNVPVLTYIATDYTLTYLNCLSYEVDIDLAKNFGTLVTEAVTPTMHALLDGLFTDGVENGGAFERHLICTNDGRILEATRGYLGEKSYLLTLVK